MAKRKIKVGRKEGQKSIGVETLINTVVKHHRKGGSQSSVARELGITPAAVSLRMKYLREQGVKGLPKFERRGGGNTAGKVADKARAALAKMGIKG